MTTHLNGPRSGNRYAWSQTLAFGDRAAEEVAQALRARGTQVIDLTKLPAAQRRGVDYLVGGEHVDIKSDRHRAVNVFLELECNDQLGCFYKSRADAWLYYYPQERKLYRLDLPRLQYHISRHPERYKERSVISGNGEDTWEALGILVPLAELLGLGIAQDVSHLLGPLDTEVAV